MRDHEQAPQNEEELDEWLSRPAEPLIEMLSRLEGPILVLGVAGKVGPTLAMMARRGLDAAGKSNVEVIGAARFTLPGLEERLEGAGIRTVRCDLLDRDSVRDLPEVPNVIFMAGQKFGTSDSPDATWAMNTLAPHLVAERFLHSRFVVFSTGCVYPLVPVGSGGSVEGDPLEPIGEYANSCVARERIFEYFSRRHGIPLAIFRLNYAIELRYGVLLDVALKVYQGEPVSLEMGHANVIWQGDANARAIQLLEYVSAPPFVLNVTGPETMSIRWLADQFGSVLGRQPAFRGEEAPTALLSNASRCSGLFGYPTVSLDTMIRRVAGWIEQGGASLNRPTHFEARDGRY